MRRSRAWTGRALHTLGAATVYALLGAATVGTPLVAAAIPAHATDSTCAVIVSTNDEHGSLQPSVYPWTAGRLAGGAEVLASYIARIRETAGCPVFVVSAGDIMQGTLISNLTRGRATIDAMNAIGYDAAAIGNHEFDFGVRVLKERIRQAHFPLLGANIYLKGTDRHPSWARPYVIVEKEGVRVGIVGATTRSTPGTTHPDSVSGLAFRSIAAALDRYIPRLRAEGVDFVVVLIHAGGFCEDDGGCTGEALDELAAASPDFDYAVTGHTHTRILDRVHGAPVIQSYANMSAVGQGRLTRFGDGEVVAEVVEIHTLFTEGAARHPEVAAVVRRYEEAAAARSAETIATLSEPLPKVFAGGSRLGRLIADAQRLAVGADVAIMNNGGIRAELPGGPINYGDLFRVQPFQNTLIRLRLRGGLLLAALEHSLSERGLMANVSGLIVEYDPDEPRGARVRCARLADGRYVRRDSTYTVVVNNFMVAGGSGYWMFKEATEAEQTGIVDLDALVTFLKGQAGPVEAPPEARWIVRAGAPAGCG